MRNTISRNSVKQFLAIAFSVQVFRQAIWPLISRANVLLELQTTKFNLEDDEESKYFSNAVQPVCHNCANNRKIGNKNDFVCVSSQRYFH